MRLILSLVVVLSACTPVDPFIGSFNVTVSGTDNQTAPSNSMQTVTGAGTMAITHDKEGMGYVVVFGEPTYQCALKGTKSMGTPLQLDVADGQTCTIGSFTAVTTASKVTLDKDTMNTGTLTVSYSFSYKDIINISHAGTGMRTYAGARF